MRSIEIWLISLLGAGCVANSFAQQAAGSASGEYLIDHWGTNEGLPQNSVLGLVQTRDRYLWLATFGGLVRFDGLTFTTFDSGIQPGIRSNRILGLCEDREGTLWIATQESGLAAYRNGKFRTYGASDGLPSNYVRAVAMDRQGELWVATWKGLMHRRNGQFEVFDAAAGLRGSDVLALAAGNNGRLWVGTNAGLHLIESGKVVAYHPQPAAALLEDRDENLWAGSNLGLTMFNARGVPVAGAVTPVPENVRSILSAADGSLWVGSAKGLWRRKGGNWTSYHTSDGLSEDYVTSLLEDSEGNIWAGTNARGLNRLKRPRIQVAGAGAGLRSENFVPVMEDHAGAMWFGSTCGGLVRFANGQYRVFEERDGLASNCVWSLFEDREKTLWIGGRNGMSRMRDGRFETFSVSNSGLSDNWVTSFWQDASGALWVGTGNGLNRFKDGVFRTYRKADGLVEDDVRFIAGDREGALWIGTTGGLSRLRSGVFTNYTRENGLPHNFVRAVHFDADGTAWIGTYGGGLARLRNGRFFVFNTANGLGENVVSRILDDGAGDFWLSGNRGIHRAGRQQLNDFADGRAKSFPMLSYSTSDGMKSRECNGGGAPAGWRSRDGRLWFPTQQGVAVIQPFDIAVNQHPPSLVIERVLVNREPAEATTRIEIPPGRSDVEVHYTGISLSAPERVRFRYRMEGLASEWVDAGSRRTAYYTQLPPGEFRFVVMAANGDGVWSEHVAALEFVVIPPFWATWWFRILLATSVVAALVFVFRRRVRVLEQTNRQQAAFSQRLIASQEAERGRIAAELHDSIGQTLAIIKNRALVSLNEPDDALRAMEQLDEIASAADHALDEVRSISYDLRPYHLDRLGLSKAIEVMVGKASGAGAIRFSAEIRGVDGRFPPEAEINVYRIVQEAVSNVVKHSGASDASVRVEENFGAVEIEIRDNGRGFAPGSSRAGGGLGLNGIAERTRLLGGELTLDTAPGKGTVLRIALKRRLKAWGAASGS